jgi:[ribosomal protein S5]-alanine N-acetyltransferase
MSPSPPSEMDTSRLHLRPFAGADAAAHGFSFWAVVERESGTLIGDAVLYLFEGRGPEVELGYTLGHEWWGRGYASEAASAWLAAAFERFGLDEIIAVADLRNPASFRVLEKIGMRRVGRRMAYGHEHLLYRKWSRRGIADRVGR